MLKSSAEVTLRGSGSCASKIIDMLKKTKTGKKRKALNHTSSGKLTVAAACGARQFLQIDDVQNQKLQEGESRQLLQRMQFEERTVEQLEAVGA
jgi:hypothetical protein